MKWKQARDFDTQVTPTLPASPLPAAVCAPAEAAASFPDGAPLPAPQLLDCSVEDLPSGGPEYLPTLKERHVDKERKCPAGKLPFLTPGAAQAMLKTFKRRRDEWREKGRHLMVYHCRECQRYHIGNAVNFQEGWDNAGYKRRPRNLPDRQRRKDKQRGRRKS